MSHAYCRQTAHNVLKGVVGLRIFTFFAALLSSVLFYTPASLAHEYWLSPITYQVNVGKMILVDIRNGENFAGSSFPYQPEKFTELIIVGNGEKRPIKSRLGDYPAVHPTVDSAGVYQIALSSTEKTLVYDEWGEFEDFLTYHGLNEFADKHRALRFPETGINEQYFRYAKTFVHAVENEGAPALLSSDDIDLLSSVQGQELELVFVNNPYTDENKIVVKLLYRGEPLANSQVELFTKRASVNRLITRTDKFGTAQFDNVPPGEHMLNAVHMLPSQKRDAHWKTLWASVTLVTVQ